MSLEDYEKELRKWEDLGGSLCVDLFYYNWLQVWGMGRKFIMVVSRQRVYHLYQDDLRVLRCHWKPKRPAVPPFQTTETSANASKLPPHTNIDEESTSTQLSPWSTLTYESISSSATSKTLSNLPWKCNSFAQNFNSIHLKSLQR